MPEAKRERAKLPERYRKHTTAKAFQNTWDAIPKSIRDDPESEFRFAGLTAPRR
jgi:hypothetical protein